MLLLRSFLMFSRILNMSMHQYVLLSLHSYFRFCFRHVQTYSSITQEHTHIYSESSVSLAYSKSLPIPIKKHIQTQWYIHNAILNILTKAQYWTFDTVLNASRFYGCYLTPRVTLRYL